MEQILPSSQRSDMSQFSDAELENIVIELDDGIPPRIENITDYGTDSSLSQVANDEIRRNPEIAFDYSVVQVDPENQQSDYMITDNDPMLFQNPGRYTNVIVPTVTGTPATGPQPSMEIYPGLLKFGIRLVTSDKTKDPQYSATLNKLYVAQNQTFRIFFSRLLDSQEDQEGSKANFFIRSVVVFTKPDSLSDPVKVCPSHADTSNNGMRDSHLMRYEGKDTVTYGTDPSTFRDYIMIEYPEIQAGATEVCVTYKFVDLSSCPGGINRRDTAIIFTLEDSCGVIYGRQVLNLRICTSPKRDFRNDEKHASANKPSNLDSKSCNFKLSDLPQTAPSPSLKRKAYWVLAHGEENYKILRRLGKDLEKKDGGNLAAYNDALTKKNGYTVVKPKIKVETTSDDSSS